MCVLGLGFCKIHPPPPKKKNPTYTVRCIYICFFSFMTHFWLKNTVYPVLWRSQHNEPAQLQWLLKWSKGCRGGFGTDVIHTFVLNAGSCRQWAVSNESRWNQTDAGLWGLSKGGSIRGNGTVAGGDKEPTRLLWLDQRLKKHSSAQFGMIHIFLHFHSSRVANSNISL